MSDDPIEFPGLPSARVLDRINGICNRFEDAWKSNERPAISSYVPQDWTLQNRKTLVRELLALDTYYRKAAGDTPQAEDYESLYSELQDCILEAFSDTQETYAELTEGLAGSSVDSVQKVDSVPEVSPPQIGRFRVISVLGRGAFGVVYKADDDKLKRPVAIKVPQLDFLNTGASPRLYLQEAESLAQLDHPHIVPVYEVGSSDEVPCFIVSKLVQGENLQQHLKKGGRLSPKRASEIVLSVAFALQHAHEKGIYHRDIKPANILLDDSGVPFVADFGLALREEDYGRGARTGGTPAYMSPEQALGEGHCVDGRTDIFSLGVVFYECLTGRRPFAAWSGEELREQILHRDVKPLVQWDREIPAELDRICSKALARSLRDRYASAAALADDLQNWLSEHVVKSLPSHQMPTIVPKDLRAFEKGDAAFFLDLLPGARDRDGLPESLQFWKQRIENVEGETFRVGLLYGPSGCGKSSFVRAGLLPRLGSHVQQILIDATPTGTESRLRNSLQALHPELGDESNLATLVAEIRRGFAPGPGQKVLIVVDQFEQWLHTRRHSDPMDLVLALRQCDGRRTQALLIVRDDFWMAVTQFFKNLEIPIDESQNSRPCKLFGPDHAKKVLIEYGRGYGSLKEILSDDNERFIEQAMNELTKGSQDVIPIKLALLSKTFEHKPWSPASLQSVGGFEQIGELYLREGFDSRSAHPHHRTYKSVCRNILRSLLPEHGSDIRGTMRSEAALMKESGASSEADFAESLRILDNELRLITPTEPGNLEETDRKPKGEKYYQLTHDYLVPAIRNWLKRDQSRREAAHTRLSELASWWSEKSESRYLPTWGEWIDIHISTKAANWTEPERRMMRRADRGVLVLLCSGLAVAVLVGIYFRESAASRRTESLVQELVSPKTAVETIQQLKGESWSTYHLEQRLSSNNLDETERFHLELALASAQPVSIDELVELLIKTPPGRDAEVCEVLIPLLEQHRDKMVAIKTIRNLILSPDVEHSPEIQANAAATLLRLSPDNVPDAVWSLFEDTPDPTVRNLLLTKLKPLRVPPGPLVDRLMECLVAESSNSQAPALVLALGEYDQRDLPATLRETIVKELLHHYEFHPDPGVHGAIDWLLRHPSEGLAPRRLDWGQQSVIAAIDTRLSQKKSDDPRGWYVNRQGQTLTVISGPVEFEYGPPLTPELIESKASEEKIDRATARQRLKSERRRRIARTFAIGTKEVTTSQWERFVNDEAWVADLERAKLTPLASPEELINKNKPFRTDKNSDDDCPVVNVNAHLAMLYCNWLSSKEGMKPQDWCYDMPIGRNLRITPDHLDRPGYRLPTELEWEYVCRAGTRTERFCCNGDFEFLLRRYAWYAENSKLRGYPVGQKRPNPLGLFDTLGHAYEWCVDVTGDNKNDAGFHSMLRGGAVNNLLVQTTYANRNFKPADVRYIIYGLRIARTIKKSEE